MSTLARIARAPGPARVRLQLLALVLLAVTRGALAFDITYPVDVANTRWALLNDTTGLLVREDMSWPRLDGRRYRVPGHTWLLRIEGEQPAVDPRLFEIVRKQDIKKAANELVITNTAKWRPRADIEADLDAAVTAHAMTCGLGKDMPGACAVAAGLAQQAAVGDTTATASERRRAQKCADWTKACVRPNEANGDTLMAAVRAAYNTRNDPVPAPIPNLDDGWTDAPPTAP